MVLRESSKKQSKNYKNTKTKFYGCVARATTLSCDITRQIQFIGIKPLHENFWLSKKKKQIK